MHKEEAKEIVVAWLDGRTSNIPGERVAILTYGDACYLGAFKDPDFVQRFHVERGTITESSMQGPLPVEQPFAEACAAAIEDLRQSGRVVERRCRAYDGTAVLYRLAR